MNSWIKKYEKDELKYKLFYEKPIQVLNLKVYFLNSNNEIIRSCKEQIDISNNILTKEQILNYFIKYKVNNKISYKLIHFLTYIINLQRDDLVNYIKNENIDYFLNQYSMIDNIKFNNCIEYFHDMNEVIFILKEKNINPLNTTRKIHFKIFNKFKKKKTRRIL